VGLKNSATELAGTARVSEWIALLRAVHRLARAFGIDSLKMLRSIADVPCFVRTAVQYRALWQGANGFRLSLLHLYPCLGNWREAAGKIDRHYFYQDLWAARKIYQARPAHHVDVGSRIDGFVAQLLCFMPVTVVDIRSLPLSIEGLTFIQDDAATLRCFADASAESLSCLHALEHFGLGDTGIRLTQGPLSRL